MGIAHILVKGMTILGVVAGEMLANPLWVVFAVNYSKADKYMKSINCCEH